MTTETAERATVHIYLPDRIWWPDTRFFIIGEAIAITDGHRHEYGFRTLRCENPTAKFKCRKDAPPEYVRGDLQRAQHESFHKMAMAAYRERYDLMLSLDYPLQLPADDGETPFPWMWLRGGAGHWWDPPEAPRAGYEALYYTTQIGQNWETEVPERRPIVLADRRQIRKAARA